MNTAFFLGANTPNGFASYYGEWLDYCKLKRFYILKGTPGNGKSGFMRRALKKLGGKGCELILCSADPSSLDGVHFPEHGVAFADGTHPHSIEPRYPLAVECYLPLTQFVDEDAVAAGRKEIVRLRDGLTAGYARLSRVLTAVKSLQDEQRSLVSGIEARGTIRRRAEGVIKREIRKGTGGALLHKRFLDALTPDGNLTLWDTVAEMADRVYELEDSYRQADAFLRPVLEAALAAGLDTYACFEPLNPGKHLRHLILPDLHLAFVTGGYPQQPYRRIRLDAAVPHETVKRYRHRLRFLRKTENALLEDACRVLADVTAGHGQLEQIYNPHVDFSGVRALADAYAERILL
jgi:hypothetical protein